MHSKIIFRERNFLPLDGSREENMLNQTMGWQQPDSGTPGPNGPTPYFLTIAQLPSAIGRNASAAGIVATSL
jgi:hypothetical protein